MKKYFKFFASILLVLCFASMSCAQTKIDWKQIKNIPDTLEFKNVLLEHLLFKSAYQPVMESVHQGAIYYDNQLERLRVYEHGQWRDLSVSIASDSIGAPLTILGYLQATDLYASQSAYIGKDVNVKGGVFASGTSILNSLKVNNTLRIPTTASTTLGVGSIYYNPTTKKLNILNSSNQWEPISIEVDSALSATSTNPVQNKVIYTKFDNFNASVTQELEQTLLDAYNYANGIATQAYNYADTAANNASSSAYNAAVSYANTQILVIDGRINTLNTNLLASLTQGLSGANASATLYASSAVTISEGYAQGLATATYNAAASYTDALRTYVDTQDAQTHTNALASATKLFVSDIATGTANGTFSFTKDGVTTSIKIVGSSFSVPIGTVLPYFGRRYVGDPIPEGFLLCDGSLVSKNDYPELFAVIGYSLDDHQSGDYFALPDLSGRFLMGRSRTDVHASTVGKYVEPGLPNITGEIKAGAFEIYNASTTSAIYTTTNYTGSEGSFQNYGLALDASRCNSIYGHSDTVQPPALVCNYIIKAY